jgi:hypothetical protein
MSMHLEGPWLSTTGKQKSKQKYRSAEHAKQARDLDSSWQQLQKNWGVEQEQKRQHRALTAPAYVAPKMEFRGSELLNRPSLGHGGGVASKKESPVYTGTKVKGIGTMHKSNAVPVFSDEEAMEISTMRRG